VLTPLFQARKTPPPLAEVYTLIAETWALSAQAPERSHLDVVIEGVRRFPRDSTLLMEATLLAARRGFREEAVALAKLGARVAKEPGEQERFQMIANSFAAETEAEATLQRDPKQEAAPARRPGPVLPEIK
jgi:hypothetical protein